MVHTLGKWKSTPSSRSVWIEHQEKNSLPFYFDYEYFVYFFLSPCTLEVIKFAFLNHPWFALPQLGGLGTEIDDNLRGMGGEGRGGEGRLLFSRRFLQFSTTFSLKKLRVSRISLRWSSLAKPKPLLPTITITITLTWGYMMNKTWKVPIFFFRGTLFLLLTS